MQKINIFPTKKDLGKRNWGRETLLCLISKKISLKMLEMNKGSSGNLQYHRKKNECGILISGKLKVEYATNKKKLKMKILKKGDVFHFPPGLIHKETAITNCVILEASTPYFNDRVRVEKLFNLCENKGLPTTKSKNIIFR